MDLPCPQARVGIPMRLNNEVDLVGCSYWIFFFWGIGVFDEAKLIQFDNQKSWCDGTLDPTNKGVKQIEMQKIHPQINHFQPPLFFFLFPHDQIGETFLPFILMIVVMVVVVPHYNMSWPTLINSDTNVNFSI